MIPVNEPLLGGREKELLCECIDSGWISSEGPFVKQFEEHFADYLISMIQGWETLHKDYHLEAEEIDLIVQNKLNHRKWGDPILIECKNWSKPVGADQITIFLDKIRKLKNKFT